MAELAPDQRTMLDRFVSVLRSRLRDTDTIAALREQLREAQDDLLNCVESAARIATEQEIAHGREIHRLTAALREGLSGKQRAKCVAIALYYTTKVWDDQIDRATAATDIEDEIGVIWLQALAERESDD